MVTHFFKHGEDDFLVDAGKEVYQLCPSLWDVGYAGTEGKRAAIDKIQQDREKALKQEYPD